MLSLLIKAIATGGAYIDLHTTTGLVKNCDHVCYPCTYIHADGTVTVKSDSSIVATIGGTVGGATLFVVVAVLLIIVIWCARLSHNKMANHTDDIDMVELDTATTPNGKADEDRFDHPTKAISHCNTATKTGNVKPRDHDYDCVLDHSIHHSKVIGTQTQYESLYHSDPDAYATIKMDSNSLVIQNNKTSNAVVENDYDFIDDDSFNNPLHLDAHFTPVSNNQKLLTKKKNMDSAFTTSNLQYCNVTTEPFIDVVDNTEYGVVNQPRSDTFSEATKKLAYMPVYGVVNQPKCDDLFSSSPPSGKITEDKYGVVNQPMNDDTMIDEDKYSNVNQPQYNNQ